jgi:hypothetical protein
MLAANLLTVVLIVPVGLVGAAPFYALWGEAPMRAGSDVLFGTPWIFLATMAGGIIVHELLHGRTWQALAMDDAAVEYGIKWKMLTPYAHVKRPITAKAYRWGAAMPGLVLGAMPLVASYGTGSGVLFWFGLVFTWVATGDAMILWMIRDVSPYTVVEDHPERAGCWVVREGGGDAARDEDPVGAE